MIQFLPLVQQHVFPTLCRTEAHSQLVSVNPGSARGYPQKQGVGKDYLGVWLSIRLFWGVSARCGVRSSCGDYLSGWEARVSHAVQVIVLLCIYAKVTNDRTRLFACD